MKHRVGYNRLGRKSAHRKALLKNLATSLFRHERIRTTRAKAKELRKYAEKILTRAKVDSVHNRRIVARSIGDKAVLAKLFTDLGPRFVSRPGGYTRILNVGQRQGDAAPVVIIELVGDETEGKSKSGTKAKRPAKSKSESTTSTVSPVVDVPEESANESAQSAEVETAAVGEASDDQDTSKGTA
jgi:large subunit ribosomal protein L17